MGIYNNRISEAADSTTSTESRTAQMVLSHGTVRVLSIHPENAPAEVLAEGLYECSMESLRRENSAGPMFWFTVTSTEDKGQPIRVTLRNQNQQNTVSLEPFQAELITNDLLTALTSYVQGAN